MIGLDTDREGMTLTKKPTVVVLLLMISLATLAYSCSSGEDQPAKAAESAWLLVGYGNRRNEDLEKGLAAIVVEYIGSSTAHSISAWCTKSNVRYELGIRKLGPPGSRSFRAGVDDPDQLPR